MMQGLAGTEYSVQISDFLTLLYNEKPQIHAGSKTWEAWTEKFKPNLKLESTSASTQNNSALYGYYIKV